MFSYISCFYSTQLSWEIASRTCRCSCRQAAHWQCTFYDKLCSSLSRWILSSPKNMARKNGSYSQGMGNGTKVYSRKFHPEPSLGQEKNLRSLSRDPITKQGYPVLVYQLQDASVPFLWQNSPLSAGLSRSFVDWSGSRFCKVFKFIRFFRFWMEWNSRRYFID